MTEVSVGPYWLYRAHPGCAARKRRKAGVRCSASPAEYTSRSEGSSGPVSRRYLSGVHGMNSRSTPWRRTASATAAASCRTSSSISTSSAPVHSVVKISCTLTSNAGDVHWRVRGAAWPTPCPRTRLTGPRWGTTTPLGSPVEPEV